jgi:hypothetical protein
VAARIQRKHQRAAAPVPAEGHRPRPVDDQAQLDRIAALLNGRPRQTLDWMKPGEMRDLLDATAA